MKFKTRKVDDVLVFDLKGGLEGGPDTYAIKDEVKTALEGGERKFLLNMDKVDFVNSTGIGIITSIYSTISSSDGTMKVCNANSKVSEIELEFLAELGDTHKVKTKKAKVGAVANRVRDNPLIFDDLDEYLTKARVPYVAALREAQNYVRAYTRGLGIFELPEYLAWPDWDEWEPLTAWLRSKRSQP